MKNEIKLSVYQFCEYAGIKWEEDMYPLIYHDYEHYELSDIIGNLPEKYKKGAKHLEKPEFQQIVSKLNGAMNYASEAGLVSECYREQQKMVERAAERLQSNINDVIWIGDDSERAKDYAKTFVKISIDWSQEEEVTVTFDANKAVKAILEIIEGEGIWGFSSVKEFLESGPYTPEEGVRSHLHYLLNAKLISDIYGLSRSSGEWEVSGWSADLSELEDRIKEDLDDNEKALLEGTLDADVYSIAVRKKELLITHKETFRKLFELEKEIEKLTPAEEGVLASLLEK